jgi:hypothetical protein
MRESDAELKHGLPATPALRSWLPPPISAGVTTLVNTLRCTLNNGRAKVPDFLRLSNSCGE